MLKLKRNTVLGLMHLAGYSTQEEFAAALGISRAWFSPLLNGHQSPTADQLVKISQLLHCTIEEIIDYPKAVALVAA